MRDRKPFVLREWLTLWNTTLAVFSTFGAWRFGEEFFHVMKNRTFEVGLSFVAHCRILFTMIRMENKEIKITGIIKLKLN